MVRSDSPSQPVRMPQILRMLARTHGAAETEAVAPTQKCVRGLPWIRDLEWVSGWVNEWVDGWVVNNSFDDPIHHVQLASQAPRITAEYIEKVNACGKSFNLYTHSWLGYGHMAVRSASISRAKQTCIWQSCTIHLHACAHRSTFTHHKIYQNKLCKNIFSTKCARVQHTHISSHTHCRPVGSSESIERRIWAHWFVCREEGEMVRSEDGEMVRSDGEEWGAIFGKLQSSVCMKCVSGSACLPKGFSGTFSYRGEEFDAVAGACVYECVVCGCFSCA